MELQLVSKEVATLAKELGFNEPSYVYSIHPEGMTLGTLSRVKKASLEDYQLLAPEQELLAKWLRDNHDILIGIVRSGNSNRRGYTYFINSIAESDWITFSTYEEAMEAGLLQVLQILKSQTNSK